MTYPTVYSFESNLVTRPELLQPDAQDHHQRAQHFADFSLSENSFETLAHNTAICGKSHPFVCLKAPFRL